MTGPACSLPDTVRPQITSLYSDLAAFDLRKRLSDFDVILRRLDSVSLTFEKVKKYLPQFKSAIQVPIYVLGIDI